MKFLGSSIVIELCMLLSKALGMNWFLKQSICQLNLHQKMLDSQSLLEVITRSQRRPCMLPNDYTRQEAKVLR